MRPGAFAALQQANRLNSKDPETFCEIGWTFMRQGNGANAAAAFSAAASTRSSWRRAMSDCSSVISAVRVMAM